jgi:hypothetical protein
MGRVSFVTPERDAIELSVMLRLYTLSQQVKVLGVFFE